MILIISGEKDGHTKVVMDALTKRDYPFYLLDLSMFPLKSQLSIQYSANSFNEAFFDVDGQKISFVDFGSVWWRRPQPFTLHDDIKGVTEGNFSISECHSAINGLWLLSDAFWINQPVNDEVAARKVYQLKIAAECGLTIPKTLVTNNPDRASAFILEEGTKNIIYKSFLATEQTWRETRIVKEGELNSLASVKYAPVIFQECIEADIDLRVTIIGNSIFPAAIHAKETSYKYDFRMNYHECKIVEHPLPNVLNKKLLQLMHRLGITYGAVDLRMRPTGEYVFLEVNPAGQWLFMEQPTGMPITQTLIQTLIDADQTYFRNKKESSIQMLQY